MFRVPTIVCIGLLAIPRICPAAGTPLRLGLGGDRLAGDVKSSEAVVVAADPDDAIHPGICSFEEQVQLHVARYSR
jgi:hypothetical protein